MSIYMTPREITYLLHSRDGWTIPQIAEMSRLSRDKLAVEIERWEDIPGKVAAIAVKRVRKAKPAPRITGMSPTELASVCGIPYQTALRWMTRGRTRGGPILLSCAGVGVILRERGRDVKESNAVEAWFRRHGLPADAGD